MLKASRLTSEEPFVSPSSTPGVTPALINGSAVTSERLSEVRSPFDGRVVGVVPELGPADIDAAVAVAVERHRGGALPTHERAAILDRIALLLSERIDEFGASISAESAKPITTATIEATRALDTIRFSAVAARTSVGEMVPLDASASGAGKLGFVKRVPIGVVAAVSPFNFPLNLVCHKIAPAVAAGCPVVLKPASATPLTALKIAALFEEAGLPPGWLNVVTTPGRVADHLVTHDDVALVTFTGSPEVGWGIRSRAARKRVNLELGNNAPIIIEPDADLADAATKIVAGGYGFSGQTCISVQRVYAHRAIHDELLDAVVTKVEALGVGDPADPSTVVSALINTNETQRVRSWIDDAVRGGAKAATGGTLRDDGVISPTVLVDVTADMQVSRDEVFGPVVGFARYDEFEDALERANDTRYGLQAAVYTKDIHKALRAIDVLDFGGVLVNETPSFRADQQPYGGLRDSGNTREGPAYAVEEMTERRMIIIQP
ncbi:MAG: aldehyde dehydrogenase family protein [Actinobacteria bacterium]|nr:aldehyde dehydrogenase family protein [Actinomycetota bacterium]